MALHTRIVIGMVIGALLGVLFGPQSRWLARDGVALTDASQVYAAPSVEGERVTPAPLDTPRLKQQLNVDGDEWWLVEWAERAEASADAPGASGEVERFGWIAAAPEARFAPAGQALVDATEWIGRLFLALIRMVVAPLVFLSVLAGVASLGDLRKLGRIGGRTLVYFVATTVAALAIGVTLATLAQPGAALADADRARLLAQAGAMQPMPPSPAWADQIVGLVPPNVFAAMVQGNMLQLLTAALIFGIALTLMPEDRSRPVVDLADRLNDMVVMVVLLAMELAPFGVAALMLKVTATTGLSVLAALGAYVAVVLVGLAVHVAVVYLPVVVFAARLSPAAFFGAMRPAMLLAFSTSSSSATLPVTKQCVEGSLGVSPQVSAFVLPLGATVNMDGTALYQGVAALFIAQVFHIDLTLGQQITVVVMATLASIGAAGVPGAGMVTLTMVLVAIGVPVEGIALIAGVDRVLDMFRTTVNVLGDATAAAATAVWEGETLTPLTAEQDLADRARGFDSRLIGHGTAGRDPR